MTKPIKSKNGFYKLPVCFKYRRTTLMLGHLTPAEAEYFSSQLNFLIAHQRSGISKLPSALEAWLQTLSPRQREQLGEIDLISKFDRSINVETLIERFLEDYEKRPVEQVRPSTKKQFRKAVENVFPKKFKQLLVAQLEPQREHHRPNAEPVFSQESIAHFRDCESWQRNHYAKSTWSRANKRLREIGHWAVRHGHVDYNPFTPLPSPGETNTERNFFVPAQWIDDAMEMCLDPDTRLVFALGRFAGFRQPAEARTLKWKHIDFDKSQMQIFDAKKHEFRTMPLFTRIRLELERHRKQIEPVSQFVLSERFRKTSDANNYGLMKEAVVRTEHQLWPRLRQNLRSSCENELLEKFEERLVTQWLGHTVKVSREHYQKPKDSDFLRAVAMESQQ